MKGQPSYARAYRMRPSVKKEPLAMRAHYANYGHARQLFDHASWRSTHCRKMRVVKSAQSYDLASGQD
jgi:hypothetical protein